MPQIAEYSTDKPEFDCSFDQAYLNQLLADNMLSTSHMANDIIQTDSGGITVTNSKEGSLHFVVSFCDPIVQNIDFA